MGVILTGPGIYRENPGWIIFTDAKDSGDSGVVQLSIGVGTLPCQIIPYLPHTFCTRHTLLYGAHRPYILYGGKYGNLWQGRGTL